MSNKDLYLQKAPDEEEGSPLRQLMSKTTGRTYVSFPSLREAQEDEHGVAVLEGDQGGTIYVVSQAKLVRCSQDELNQLLYDVDALVWQEPEFAHIYFESRPVGSIIAGGCGGGQVSDEIWVHEKLRAVQQEIRAVIKGDQARIHVPAS